MRLVTLYGIGRLAFGGGAVLAPSAMGRGLAGPGGATPDAQAFLRGIGAREIGIGLGLLGAARAHRRIRPWLIAGVLADAGDIAGIAGAWQHMKPSKRSPGVTLAGVATAAGLWLIATDHAS